MRMLRFVCLLPTAYCILILSGCTSAVESGHNTALDAVDLQQMTDDMAAKIVADPQVQAAIAKEGQLPVVVQPVENRMVAEVLPRGPAQAFTARVRVLLSKHAPDRFLWVMNRDAFYELRNREVDIDLGPQPERVQPRYALTSIFSSLTKEDPKRRSAYYLCEYQLTDLASGNLLWTGSYEVKKIAVRQFLD
jgi:PBP1b-binding outer membrane lipoprotein LpoB